MKNENDLHWMRGRIDENFPSRENNEYPFILVEPSTGRIVEIEVTEKDETAANILVMILKGFIELYEKHFGASSTIDGRKFRIEFPDVEKAEMVRQVFFR